MKYRYEVTANSSKPEIYHDGNILVFAEARCDYKYIPKNEEMPSGQPTPLTCWRKVLRFIGVLFFNSSPYWVSIIYALMCLVLAFKDPDGYIISVAFFLYSLFELVLELFEGFFRICGIKKQTFLLALLFISLILGIYVVPDCYAFYKFINDNGTIFQAFSLLFIFSYQFVVALKHYIFIK